MSQQRAVVDEAASSEARILGCLARRARSRRVQPVVHRHQLSKQSALLAIRAGGGPSASAGLGLRGLWAFDPWLPADGPGCPPASAPAEGAGGLSFDGIWGGAVPGGACPLYLGSAAPEWASAAHGPRGGGGACL